MKNKLFISALISIISFSAHAGDQVMINKTGANILVGYKICVKKDHNKNAWDCSAEKSVTVPAKSKISSPFPNLPKTRAFNTPESYITSVASPSGRFSPVYIPTRAEWYAKCNNRQAPLECRQPITGNQDIWNDSRATGGAWILDDHGVAGFISMRHVEEGPSGYSY